MSNSLFIFTISPVQSFIAQARKTVDLFGGSKLLLDLVGEAIGVLSGIELIYPAKDALYKPNDFIGIVSTDKLEGLKTTIEKTVKEKLNCYFCEALKNEKIDDETRQKCIRQLESLFNIS